MTMHLLTPNFFEHVPTETEKHRNILIICDKNRWMGQGRDISKTDNCWYLEIDGLTSVALAQINPAVVLSPLFGIGFDALDIAEKLSQLAYMGPYRALTDKIPNPDNICGEVRAIAPNIDFNLIILEDRPEPVKAVSDPA